MRTRELVRALDARVLPAVLARLQTVFPARRRGPRSEKSLYLDTFDRRIQQAGETLQSTVRGEEFELLWQGNGASLRSRCRELPAFARELPEGPLHDGLGERIEARRLLPLVEIERQVSELELLDGESKTIARVRAIERCARRPGSDAPGRRLGPLFVAQPVRGYAQPFRRLAALLEEQPELLPHEEGELEEALEALGLPRLVQRVAVEVSPTMAAGEALRAVLRAELETMLAQEDGLRRDLDLEFLHDWRVAVRRTRCGLRQMRRVLPAAAVERFSAELRWLNDESGPLRDLDILIEGVGETELAGESRPALGELVAFAREERARECSRFLQALDGARCRVFLREWRGFLSEDGSADPPGEPVLSAVSRRLRRRRRQVLRSGGSLGPGSPPAELHRLRIECKKLRYLLDLFRSLYPPAEVLAGVSAVKRFQTALGEANDASVQARLLEEMAGRMHATGRASPAGLLAAGRLQALLDERRSRATEEFLERFRAFRKDRELFRFLEDGGREEPW